MSRAGRPNRALTAAAVRASRRDRRHQTMLSRICATASMIQAAFVPPEGLECAQLLLRPTPRRPVMGSRAASRAWRDQNPNGFQSTGLLACRRGYGLVELARRSANSISLPLGRVCHSWRRDSREQRAGVAGAAQHRARRLDVPAVLRRAAAGVHRATRATARAVRLRHSRSSSACIRRGAVAPPGDATSRASAPTSGTPTAASPSRAS